MMGIAVAVVAMIMYNKKHNNSKENSDEYDDSNDDSAKEDLLDKK